MNVRSTRDWRGIKQQVSRFSNDELQNLRNTATNTSEHIARFIESIDNEMRLRRVDTDSTSA